MELVLFEYITRTLCTVRSPRDIREAQAYLISKSLIQAMTVVGKCIAETEGVGALVPFERQLTRL